MSRILFFICCSFVLHVALGMVILAKNPLLQQNMLQNTMQKDGSTHTLPIETPVETPAKNPAKTIIETANTNPNKKKPVPKATKNVVKAQTTKPVAIKPTLASPGPVKKAIVQKPVKKPLKKPIHKPIHKPANKIAKKPVKKSKVKSPLNLATQKPKAPLPLKKLKKSDFTKLQDNALAKINPQSSNKTPPILPPTPTLPSALQKKQVQTAKEVPDPIDKLPTEKLVDNTHTLIARDYIQLRQQEGNPLPHYPEQALENKWEGEVELIYYVNTYGEVEKIRVHKTSGHTVLDNAAIRTLARYHYYPGQEGWVRHPVNFTLDKTKEIKQGIALRVKPIRTPANSK